MTKQEILQQAVSLLMAHADEDFVSKKEALDAGTNLHNLMIEMNNPTNPQDNAPQSGESVQNAIIENQLDITGWAVGPDSTMRTMIAACMNEYAAPLKARTAVLESSATIRTDNSKVIATLQERITELEAQNKSYREALEEIADVRKLDVKYIEPVMLIVKAEQALNPKPLTDG